MCKWTITMKLMDFSWFLQLPHILKQVDINIDHHYIWTYWHTCCNSKKKDTFDTVPAHLFMRCFYLNKFWAPKPTSTSARNTPKASAATVVSVGLATLCQEIPHQSLELKQSLRSVGWLVTRIITYSKYKKTLQRTNISHLGTLENHLQKYLGRGFFSVLRRVDIIFHQT